MYLNARAPWLHIYDLNFKKIKDSTDLKNVLEKKVILDVFAVDTIR